MILNMPVTNGAITSVPSQSQSQSEYCDFLKRKYPDNDISHPQQTTAPTNYQEHNGSTNSAWKKRHIDDTSYEIPANSTYNSHHSPAAEEYPPNGSSQPNIPTTDATTGTGTSTGTFNIIANSTSFINDLFAYDANLLVPVSSSSISSASLGDSVPTFTTPSTICVNTTQQFDEDNGDNWQASDLLELDHRYNSSLQTEITHLNPTVSLKPHEETLVNMAGHTPPPARPASQQMQFLQSQKSPAAKPVPALDSETDFEDKNLSWLLNFKFDEFPHLNPDVASANNKSVKSHHSNGPSTGCKTLTGSPLNSNNSNGSLGNGERSKSPKNSNKTGKKFEELVMEVTAEMDGNDMTVAENVVIQDTAVTHRAPKKPPFTYTELIEYALEDKGELTVSGIYQWISDRFPYYKSNDDRWKNSVRHNLSINPHFRKGHKAPQGAGHLWTISSGDSAENVLAWEHKKQRLDLFFKMESMNRERMAQHLQQQQQAATVNAKQPQHIKQHIGCQQDQCLYDEAAVAAAAIQREMMQQQGQCGSSGSSNSTNEMAQQHRNVIHPSNDSSHHPKTLHDLPYNELLSDEELRKTAGQILNGIHRDVEVQSVNHQSIISTYQDVLLDNEDYLNPVHKDVAVNESGLRHIASTVSSSSNTHCHSAATQYYVTEIDPMELGIQMSSHPQPLAPSNNHHHHHHHHHHHGHDPTNAVNGAETDVVLFNDEFNLNYFTYNPATDIVV